MVTLFGRTLSSLNLLASVWIMVIVALISADVLGRSLFNTPVQGVPEIIKFSVVGMFWLQMAYVLREKAHLRSTLLLGPMPPWAQRIVLVLNSIVGIVVFALIVRFAVPELMKAWEIDEWEGAPPVRIPVWPIWSLIVLGAALTVIQFAIDTVKYLRGEIDLGESKEL
jgi:TRAP-type C4-dicarboxylate transport system permease small subunit